MNTKTKICTKAAALITAALIAAVLLFTACPNSAGGNSAGGGSGSSNAGASGGSSGSGTPPAPPTVQKYAVTFGVEGGSGTLTAQADGIAETAASPITVEKDKTVTFTATAAPDYTLDEWTITGGTFETGGTPASTSATVKITAATTVKVSFSRYKKVPFGTNGADLNTYLNNQSPASDGIYYIEVTGLTAPDLKGSSSEASALGKILKNNSAKKVALKLPKTIAGLTDMSFCFKGCTNLAHVTEIPAGVTNMIACFSGCTSLTQAPRIPDGVTRISSCFNGCKSLTQAPEIPSGVTDMRLCFQECIKLTQAPEIPDSVTNMQKCFKSCTSLTQVPRLSANVTDMQSCFENCTSLTRVPEIPAKVKNMKECFRDCKRLTSVTLKCNYNNSFQYAFQGCYALKQKSIKVPQNQLETYKKNTSAMGVRSDRFVADK